MLPDDDDCGECRPGGRTPTLAALTFSALPFIATFLFVSLIVLRKLIPILSGYASPNSKRVTPNLSPFRFNARRFSAFTSSTTIALAAVLVELILCEVSNTIDPNARRLAFQFTISLLLFILVVVIPSLEIHSVTSAAGWDYTGKSKGTFRIAWLLQAIGTAIWLALFWWTGERLLSRVQVASLSQSTSTQTLTEACLSRFGIIGISFMALLSGFASVSAPWQNLFSKQKPVTESTIARKATGLEATNDMLKAKQSRLRALERKMSDLPQEQGFFQKAIGTFRGNADHTELKSLEIEIKGLETMAQSLSTSHNNLSSRLQQQKRRKTFRGRLLLAFSYAFSIFCLYRILTSFYSTVRRSIFHSYTQTSVSSPKHMQVPKTSSPSSPSTDPITTFLALFATHYDPHLNLETSTRHLSFLLSFLILLASFNSVMQTFSLVARF
ncbi:MAG: hypothetical protein Q9174_002749, partial [Haloplaca sp. 1 TL-2023]